MENRKMYEMLPPDSKVNMYSYRFIQEISLALSSEKIFVGGFFLRKYLQHFICNLKRRWKINEMQMD